MTYKQAIFSRTLSEKELSSQSDTAFVQKTDSSVTIFYNDKMQPTVQNSALAAILADLVLDTPEQKTIFIRNLLAPCQAVLSLIRAHGYRIIDTAPWESWPLDDPDTPLLIGLPFRPDPRYLVAKAFLLHPRASAVRLNAIGEDMEYADASEIPMPDISFASGWYCKACGGKRLLPGTYCSHCGSKSDFDFIVTDKPWKRSSPSRGKNGRFYFCPVCGEDRFKDNDRYCHRCGSPLYNPCLNEKTSGYIKRLIGLKQVEGTHYCLPDDRFCAVCGSQVALPITMELTHKRWEFPKHLTPDMLTSGKDTPIRYPDVDEKACPKCGSYKRIGISLVCEDCGTLVNNVCLRDNGHLCLPSDHYCRTCGSETRHTKAGILLPFFKDPSFIEKYKPEGNSND